MKDSHLTYSESLKLRKLRWEDGVLEGFEKGIVEGLEIASRFISLLNEGKFKDEASREEVARMILELKK